MYKKFEWETPTLKGGIDHAITYCEYERCAVSHHCVLPFLLISKFLSSLCSQTNSICVVPSRVREPSSTQRKSWWCRYGICRVRISASRIFSLFYLDIPLKCRSNSWNGSRPFSSHYFCFIIYITSYYYSTLNSAGCWYSVLKQTAFVQL